MNFQQIGAQYALRILGLSKLASIDEFNRRFEDDMRRRGKLQEIHPREQLRLRSKLPIAEQDQHYADWERIVNALNTPHKGKVLRNPQMPKSIHARKGDVIFTATKVEPSIHDPHPQYKFTTVLEANEQKLMNTFPGSRPIQHIQPIFDKLITHEDRMTAAAQELERRRANPLLQEPKPPSARTLRRQALKAPTPAVLPTKSPAPTENPIRKFRTRQNLSLDLFNELGAHQDRFNLPRQDLSNQFGVSKGRLGNAYRVLHGFLRRGHKIAHVTKLRTNYPL